jgi:hypothetical protein
MFNLKFTFSLKIVNGSSHSFDPKEVSENRLVKFKPLETCKEAPVFALLCPNGHHARFYVYMTVNKNSEMETRINGFGHCIVNSSQADDKS